MRTNDMIDLAEELEHRSYVLRNQAHGDVDLALTVSALHQEASRLMTRARERAALDTETAPRGFASSRSGDPITGRPFRVRVPS